MNQLNSSKEIMNIMLKLPQELRKKWREKTLNLTECGKDVTFAELVKFLRYQSKLLNQPMFGQVKEQTPKKNDDKWKATDSKERRVFATSSTETVKENKIMNKYENTQGAVGNGSLNNGNDKNKLSSASCIYCKRDNHSISYCYFFKKKPYSERLELIKERKLCFGCLERGHTSRECISRMTCKVCSRKHPTALHRDATYYNGDKSEFRKLQGQSTSLASKRILHPYAGAGDDKKVL